MGRDPLPENFEDLDIDDSESEDLQDHQAMHEGSQEALQNKLLKVILVLLKLFKISDFLKLFKLLIIDFFKLRVFFWLKKIIF